MFVFTTKPDSSVTLLNRLLISRHHCPAPAALSVVTTLAWFRPHQLWLGCNLHEFKHHSLIPSFFSAPNPNREFTGIGGNIQLYLHDLSALVRKYSGMIIHTQSHFSPRRGCAGVILIGLVSLSTLGIRLWNLKTVWPVFLAKYL